MNVEKKRWVGLEATRWAWECKEVCGSKKLVLLAYASFADEDGNSVYPGMQTIADMCGLSVDQARRHTHSLTDDGRLELVSAGGWVDGRNATSKYRLPMGRTCTDTSTVSAPVQEGYSRTYKGGSRADASTVLAYMQDDQSYNNQYKKKDPPSIEQNDADASSVATPPHLDGLSHISVLAKDSKETNLDIADDAYTDGNTVLSWPPKREPDQPVYDTSEEKNLPGGMSIAKGRIQVLREFMRQHPGKDFTIEQLSVETRLMVSGVYAAMKSMAKSGEVSEKKGERIKGRNTPTIWVYIG